MSTRTAQPGARRRPPWLLLLPAGLVAAGLMAPLAYLVLRAAEADWATLSELVLRRRNLWLLTNTLALVVSVLAVVTALALPMTWLLTRTDLVGRRPLTLLAVLPLAIPAYLMAYTLLAVGGENGTVAALTGLTVPRLSGFWGATIALALYNVPYMLLNLRVAFARMDPSLEEAARSLGHPVPSVFARIVLPQLAPAYGAGALLVIVHVIGDFGVVSLMRYESFSYALYVQYESGFDRVYAAWLALMLIGLAGLFLVLEWRFLRGLRLDPVGAAAARQRRRWRLGPWQPAGLLFLGAVGAASVLVPVGTIVYWLSRHPGDALVGDWLSALTDSVSASLPAAAVATLLALPVVHLAARHPARWTRLLERGSYLGYATPPLAFALALVFFSLRVTPLLYQTLALLVGAYAIHFLAEAVGPLRSAMAVASPRLEEAGRSLGAGRVATFFRVTLPLLRPGIVVSVALVFLSAMKELPLTLILSPLGFETLATAVWSYTGEYMFAEAAPYALTIVAFSAVFVGLLLLRGHEERA